MCLNADNHSHDNHTYPPNLSHTGYAWANRARPLAVAGLHLALADGMELIRKSNVVWALPRAVKVSTVSRQNIVTRNKTSGYQTLHGLQWSSSRVPKYPAGRMSCSEHSESSQSQGYTRPGWQRRENGPRDAARKGDPGMAQSGLLVPVRERASRGIVGCGIQQLQTEEAQEE
jgi:hypothetical protein